MAVITGDIIPLNRTDAGYAAFEGLAGTMVQPYLVRLNAPVEASQLKRVTRELVTAYPKLRSKLEAGLHRYHLRVMPDDEIVDQLFDLAFRIDAHINIDDGDAFEAWHTQMVHEVFPLEKGLGIRIWFVPHPERAAFMIGVPHLFADGMTMVQMVTQILRGLNGHALDPMIIEAPAMIGSVAPEHWWQWPRQMWRSRQHKVAEKRRLASLNIQQLPTKLGLHYSTTGVRHVEMSTGTASLRAVARQSGVSLNTLLISALAQTFLDQAPNDPQAAAVIRISVSLRKYYPKSAGHGPLWGNHVAAFLVIEQDAQKSWAERLKSVDASIREGQARFARREMCWGYVWDELTPWLGRTLLSHVATKLKRAQRFPVISCHATSLGDINAVNAPDATVRADMIVAAVNSIAALPALIEVNGRLFVPMSWQLAETSYADIDAFLKRLDQNLSKLAQLAPVKGSMTESEKEVRVAA